MPDDKLNLTDAAYWDAPTSTQHSVFEQLRTDRLNGVLIGAPGHVSLDTRHTLPVVAYRAGTFFDIRSLQFSLNAILVGVDLDRNTMRFGDAVEVEDRSVSPSDSASIPDGYAVSPYVIDARERLAISWQPGSYLFSIILRDRISNRVKVSLGKPATSYHDEAVDEFIAKYRRRQPPPTIYPALDPGNLLPCYRPLPECPPLPTKNGVSIKLDRVLLLNSETRWILRGAFRLSILPHEVVTPSEPLPRDHSAPTAITRITLLAVGAEYGKWDLELSVPSYDPIERGNGGPVATGYFSLDLMRETHIRAAAAQTYFIYAFSGETVAGPIASALVPESWLLPER